MAENVLSAMVDVIGVVKYSLCNLCKIYTSFEC